jgi:hypothetical protein
MSFTNAPVTRTLVLGLVASSIAANLLDVKHYFYIVVDTHIIRYHQPWRAFLYQLCYTNSSEVLFAAMTLYNMRVIERMWGSRKYAVSSSPWLLRALQDGELISCSPSSSLQPASRRSCHQLSSPWCYDP